MAAEYQSMCKHETSADICKFDAKMKIIWSAPDEKTMECRLHLAPYVLTLRPAQCHLKVTELVQTLDNKNVFVKDDPPVLDQDLEFCNVSTMLH